MNTNGAMVQDKIKKVIQLVAKKVRKQWPLIVPSRLDEPGIYETTAATATPTSSINPFN